MNFEMALAGMRAGYAYRRPMWVNGEFVGAVVREGEIVSFFTRASFGDKPYDFPINESDVIASDWERVFDHTGNPLIVAGWSKTR